MTEYQSTTTLRRIRDEEPCKNGWEKLLAHLGKTAADDEPLDLLTVLDSNGFDDAMWVLSYAMPEDRLARHFQAWCAEQVLPIFEAACPGDMRVRDQIAMLRNDAASDAERVAASDATRVAALATAWAARDAARVAARDAAWAATRIAALVTAWVASDAAWAASDAGAASDAQEEQLRKMLAMGDTP